MTFKRLFMLLALLSLVALLAALLSKGVPDGPEALVGLILLVAWMGGPFALAYLLSSGDEEGSGRRAMFVYFVLAAGLTAWTFASVWSSDNSTAAVALFFLPVYTWAGLIVTALATAAITGWRPSLSAPVEPPPRQ